MAENRYVKLNANWMDSEWLIVLSAEARLAWVQLLCYVKAYGIGGRVKSKSPAVFAKQNFLGEESVEQMLRAAKADGALELEEGEWVLTGWSQHQGDATTAERSKRYRERLKGEDRHGSHACRHASHTEEKRGEERKGEENKTTSKKQSTSTHGVLTNAESRFEAFAGEYPKRDGDTCKAAAKRKHLKKFADAEFAQTCIDGAKRYRLHCDRKGISRTDKVAQMLTWLNQERWTEEYENLALATSKPTGADEDRQWPKEGLDYALVYHDGSILKCELDKTTPFSEDAWRKSRGLLTRSEMAEMVSR